MLNKKLPGQGQLTQFLSGDILVRTECVHTHVVRAKPEVVATKLRIIIIIFFFFPFFLPYTYFSQLLCGHGVRALWISEHPPRHTHINYLNTNWLDRTDVDILSEEFILNYHINK